MTLINETFPDFSRASVEYSQMNFSIFAAVAAKKPGPAL
jgi:hypothetical protein